MTEVTFFTEIEELKLANPPQPAKEFWPEWFKKQKGPSNIPSKCPVEGVNMIKKPLDEDKGLTVKSCPGILDVLSYGYIIPLWSDYMVQRFPVSKDAPHGIGWRMPDGNDDKFRASLHTQAQIDAYPFPPDTFKGSFKLTNPWFIKTPPGYSCYICAPHYNKHPNLTILSGIIDTDIYHDGHINTWFTAPLNEEILLPYGMPIAQVIPFKREKFEMKAEIGDHRSLANKVTHFIHSAIFERQHYRKKLTTNRYK